MSSSKGLKGAKANSKEPIGTDKEITVHLPEHQQLLSFNNDSMSVGFSEWWIVEGELEFRKWYEKNRSRFDC